MRRGRYRLRFSRVFTSAVSGSRRCLVRLASDLFRSDHAPSIGLNSGVCGGNW